MRQAEPGPAAFPAFPALYVITIFWLIFCHLSWAPAPPPTTARTTAAADDKSRYLEPEKKIAIIVGCIILRIMNIKSCDCGIDHSLGEQREYKCKTQTESRHASKMFGKLNNNLRWCELLLELVYWVGGERRWEAGGGQEAATTS